MAAAVGGIFSGLMGGGSKREPAPAPLPPSEDPAKAAERAAAEERARTRAGAGRASTILTSPLGVTNGSGTSATKSILG